MPRGCFSLYVATGRALIYLLFSLTMFMFMMEGSRDRALVQYYPHPPLWLYGPVLSITLCALQGGGTSTLFLLGYNLIVDALHTDSYFPSCPEH